MKFNEVLKSLGICWWTLAVICQASMKSVHSRGLWWGLLVFHLMNTYAILSNSRMLDLDAIVSIIMFVICAYALRETYKSVAPKSNKVE